MIKVLFVCHGNICRSPMAEFIFRDMVAKRGLSDLFTVESAATSAEEIGNPVHPGTVRKLREYGICDVSGKYAVQFGKKDYEAYDYLVVMDRQNQRNLMRIIGADPECKVHKLLEYSDRPRDIADPWYTGNFEITYEDVIEGCETLLQHILENDL